MIRWLQQWWKPKRLYVIQMQNGTMWNVDDSILALHKRLGRDGTVREMTREEIREHH